MQKRQKINKYIISIVCLLSMAVYVRNCADRQPYRIRTGVRPKWRVNVMLTRCISNHSPKFNNPYSFPRLFAVRKLTNRIVFYYMCCKLIRTS